MTADKDYYRSKNVLVTGGEGFIGSNIVRRLVEIGANVRVIDNRESGTGCNPSNLDGLSLDVEVRRCGDPGAKEAILDAAVIFNIAGKVSHHASMLDPLADMAANALDHLKLLDICREHEHRPVVLYASTRQFYGSAQFLPVDETHPIAPVDINGIHKFAGESYHSVYSSVHGIPTVSLRLTNTYGPRQCISDSGLGFVGWFIHEAMRGRTIELFDGGEAKRDFNYVDDVVNAFLTAGADPECYGRTFNLSGEMGSIRTVAEILQKICPGCSVTDVSFPSDRKKIAIEDYYGDSNRFRDLTGWRDSTPLETGLARTVEFFEANRRDYIAE
jgi:nucleoside-diphosphate-sugar epimerase